MKLQTLIGGLLAFTAASASAASYSVNNGNGADANGIANSAGEGFKGNGVAGIGTFGSSFDFGTADAASLIGAFTGLGATSAFQAAGLFGNNGLVSFGPGGQSTPLDGSSIYLFVGNGNTFADSTEFLVLQNSRNFLASDDASGTPFDVLFTEATSTLRLGGTLPDLRTTNADSSVTPGWTTAPAGIPEPSVALLGALGVLGLVRRRR